MFISRVISIVKQFRLMGATVPEALCEFIHLIVDKNYFVEWDQFLSTPKLEGQ